MKTNKTVNFRNNSRIHFGLVVTDLQQSIGFYRTLFQTEPRKVKPDYAKFELDDPSINLALDLRDEASQRESAVTHFGIQVKSQEAIDAAKQRMQAAGWNIETETQTTCCYAEQNKIWASDPDGNRWEVFLVTDYDATRKADPESACCASSASALGNEGKAACC